MLKIPSAIDQAEGEHLASWQFNGLIFLNPTQECSDAIQPYICLNLFGLCDINGDFHTTLRGECLRLRDGICSREWQTAKAFLPVGILPECEDLPDEVDVECTGIYLLNICLFVRTYLRLHETMSC